MFVGGGAKKENFAKQLLGMGFGKIDYRDLDSTAPDLVSTMEAAKAQKTGMWSIESKLAEDARPVKKEGGQPEVVKTVRISEIRNGNHFFFHEVGDAAVAKVADAMKALKELNGVAPGPVTFKKGKVLAALFNDGKEVGWFRAKVLEKISNNEYKVLYIDHGNVGMVTAKQCRVLDNGYEFTPAVAKECELALTKARDLSFDEGVQAARMLSRLAWDKEVSGSDNGSESDEATTMV